MANGTGRKPQRDERGHFIRTDGNTGNGNQGSGSTQRANRIVAGNHGGAGADGGNSGRNQNPDNSISAELRTLAGNVPGTNPGTATLAESRTGETTDQTREATPDILVQENEPVKKAKRHYTPRGSSKKLAAVVDTSGQTATAIMAILDSVAQTLVGREAAMNEIERALIESPLARTLARLDPGVSESVSKFADPLTIVVALGMWGNRVAAIAKQKNAQTKNVRAAVAEPEPAQPQPVKFGGDAADILGNIPASEQSIITAAI